MLTWVFSSTMRPVLGSQICSGEVVHRAFFCRENLFLKPLLVGVEFPLFVTRPLQVGLQCDNISTFFFNKKKTCESTKMATISLACRTSLPVKKMLEPQRRLLSRATGPESRTFRPTYSWNMPQSEYYHVQRDVGKVSPRSLVGTMGDDMITSWSFLFCYIFFLHER